MSDKIVVIHDTNSGQIIERAITAEELAQFDLRQAEAKSEAEIRLAKAAQKAALLEKLGITEDEAKLLLG
jgi:hypothetical protein